MLVLGVERHVDDGRHRSVNGDNTIVPGSARTALVLQNGRVKSNPDRKRLQLLRARDGNRHRHILPRLRRHIRRANRHLRWNRRVGVVNDDPRLNIGNRIRDKPVFVHRRYAGQTDRRLRHLMLILGIELKLEVSAIADNLVGRAVPSAPQRSTVCSAKFQHLLIPFHRRRKIRQLLVARHLHRNLELRQRVHLHTRHRQRHRRGFPRIRVREHHRTRDRFRQNRRKAIVVDAGLRTNRDRRLVNRVILQCVETIDDRGRHTVRKHQFTA